MKVIGIDIGGTKTIIGIIDIAKGKIIKKISISSKQFQNDKENLKSIVSNTIDIIGKLKIKKIGIGVPELIDNKGIIRGDYNFNWLNKNLADNFPRKFKVIVDSDVRCHLRAEECVTCRWLPGSPRDRLTPAPRPMRGRRRGTSPPRRPWYRRRRSNRPPPPSTAWRRGIGCSSGPCCRTPCPCPCQAPGRCVGGGSRSRAGRSSADAADGRRGSFR